MFARRFLILPTLAASFFVFGLLGVAQAADEQINSFNSSITVQKNGSIEVKETIQYNFGTNQKHGIFRDIPLTAKDGPDIGITVNSVMNANGSPYHYVETVENGNLDIKIGDANVLVSGVKTYVIDYTVTNVIRPFEDHDELYWNVTGNGWPVPILRAQAEVTVAGSTLNDLRVDCFTGSFGSTEKSCLAGGNLSGVEANTTASLGVGEGMTIVVGFPLGIVDDTVVENPVGGPSSDTTLSNGDWVFLLAPLLLLFAIFVIVVAAASKLFRNRGGYRGPVVVQYQPPEGLSPLDVGALLDQSVDTRDISAVILDLAVRGFLKIRYTVQEIKFWPDKKDFEFVKQKDGASLTHPGEKLLFDHLFTGQDTVTLSQLLEDKTGFHSTIEAIKTETDEYLRDKGYYDRAAKAEADKNVARLSIILAVVVIGSVLLSSVTGGVSAFLMFPAVLFIIIRIGAMNRLAKKFTEKGIAAQAGIAGFKEFLQLTEKDKLDLLNAPKLEPETFEKFLPYAMALGVETAWAKKFEGLYESSPTWYEDPTSRVFSSALLVSNLQRFNGSFSQAVVNSAPRSSSGFSGGSSGGGSGGGGGGSW